MDALILSNANSKNNYGPFLMQLFMDLGYISQKQLETIDGLCKSQGPILPDNCKAALAYVNPSLT
jgi:hypothetical protein